MKRAWEVTHLAFVWLLIAIGFLAVFQMCTVVARATGSTKDFWDIATAIGTWGAVAVALYVALIGQRKQKKDEWLKGALTAASVQQRVINTHDSLEIAIRRIKDMGDTLALIRSQQDDEKIFSEVKKHTISTINMTLREVITTITDASEITFDEMHTMTGLPGNCAIQIADAQAKMRNAVEILEQSRTLTFEARERKIHLTARPLTDAATLLKNAIRIIQRETKSVTTIHSGNTNMVD
ncbi:hypothetical protein [Burkholderia gladioli]|uniref:hypothetical protein n=1 Tax=Burkholderia gladioli TaxID=28095 RepID=UPI002FE2039C